jgi:agmatine deiminase
MMNRRLFLQGSLGGLLMPHLALGAPTAWRMPDEAEPHRRTWMAFGASQAIWGQKLLPEVRRNLALIANTIVRFEPVSVLVRPEEMALAQKLFSPKVKLHSAALNDLWMRDTGCVFVTAKGAAVAGIDFNFNGWGDKQAYNHDQNVAALIAKKAGATSLESGLVLEGGALEVDGQGSAIICESCVLNDNRNPGVAKREVERELKALLGLEKIIWLPGIKDMDITDGHTDFYARFARPGVVVAGYDPDPQSFDHAVTKEHQKILKAASDARGKPLEVVTLTAPSRIRDKFSNKDFAAGYINFYVCNGAVIAPEFGDPIADVAAQTTLMRLFPKRLVVQLNIDGIAAGGGGIHCTTQQEPEVI